MFEREATCFPSNVFSRSLYKQINHLNYNDAFPARFYCFRRLTVDLVVLETDAKDRSEIICRYWIKLFSAHESDRHLIDPLLRLFENLTSANRLPAQGVFPPLNGLNGNLISIRPSG